MDKEYKELLLRDLCARLPYGVKGLITYCDGVSETVAVTYPHVAGIDMNEDILTIKPYLRPMSDMTEEEHSDFYALSVDGTTGAYYQEAHISVDWLNSHNFDYRGLIDKGLALRAPEGMYNNIKEV